MTEFGQQFTLLSEQISEPFELRQYQQRIIIAAELIGILKAGYKEERASPIQIASIGRSQNS